MRISDWSSDVCSSDLLSFELARALEKAGQSGFDTRLVLLAQAVQDKEWDRAVEIRNGLSKENQLLLALPVIDYWICVGRGKDDPLAPIKGVGGHALAESKNGSGRCRERGV